MFFGHNSAIFWAHWAEICVGAQENIIDRMVMKNPGHGDYFPILIFWATFGMKMGMATTHTPNGLGPPNPT